MKALFSRLLPKNRRLNVIVSDELRAKGIKVKRLRLYFDVLTLLVGPRPQTPKQGWLGITVRDQPGEPSDGETLIGHLDNSAHVEWLRRSNVCDACGGRGETEDYESYYYQSGSGTMYELRKCGCCGGSGYQSKGPEPPERLYLYISAPRVLPPP